MQNLANVVGGKEGAAPSGTGYFTSRQIEMANWSDANKPSGLIDRWCMSTENLWSDFKLAVHQWKQSNLKELEPFCFEYWSKNPSGKTWQALTDLSKVTCSCNCCKMWLYKVLTLRR